MVKAGEARKEKADAVLEILHDLYPGADCALNYSEAHELLFATIMSAQTTDVTVNRVTETLFDKYRTVEDFANADMEEFQQEIRPTGFYRNKASHVIGAANMIVNEYGGEVPDTMEELVKLPGVARKTANVVLGTYFGKASGFVVDTHVKRVSYRIGLTAETRPPKVEKDLMACIPQDEWIFAGHAFIDHGRAICDARNPLCEECAIRPHCERNGV